MTPDNVAGSSRADVRLANETWESFITVYSRFMGGFGAEPIWQNASMREYDVLYTLAKASTPLRLNDLCEGVLLSQPALSRLVDRLVGRGLVAREPDPEDGRAVRIRLTETGTEVQREIGRTHGRSVNRELTSRLTSDELEELQALCRKLLDR